MQFFEPIFPSGLVISQQARSAEELEKYEHAWNLKVNLLKKQKFYSLLDLFHTPYTQMALTRRSLKNTTHGETPPNTIMFAFIANDATLIQQKQLLSSEDIFILEHGGEVAAIFTEPIELVTICIHAEILRKSYKEKYKEECTVCKDGKVRKCDKEIFSI